MKEKDVDAVVDKKIEEFDVEGATLEYIKKIVRGELRKAAIEARDEINYLDLDCSIEDEIRHVLAMPVKFDHGAVYHRCQEVIVHQSNHTFIDKLAKRFEHDYDIRHLVVEMIKKRIYDRLAS